MGIWVFLWGFLGGVRSWNFTCGFFFYRSRICVFLSRIELSWLVSISFIFFCWVFFGEFGCFWILGFVRGEGVGGDGGIWFRFGGVSGVV